MKKIMTLAAMFAAVMVSFSSCEKEGNNGNGNGNVTTCPECGEPEADCTCEDYQSPITIDGEFADWDALDAAYVATATCNPDAKWTALTKVKAYCDGVYLNVYFEFSEDEIVDLAWVPFHVYINQDNSEAAGNDQFIGQGGQDWLLEGAVIADGAFCSYNPALFSYDGAEDTVEWAYGEVLPEGSGIGSGAGAGNKYEFALMVEMLQGVELSDVFGIGFDIQQDWNSVGVLPNTAIADDNANGAVPMLQVTIQK